MDYNGTNSELYKYQWDYIHNPQQGIVRWLVEDEEGEAIRVDLIFDENDLKQYKLFIKELKQFPFFKKIYDYLDNSEEYFNVVDMQLTLSNMGKFSKSANGHFKEAKTIENEYLWGLFSITSESGTSDNPHTIALYSSKNMEMTKKGEYKGNGFKSTSTIFEEFFHAAHYLYLKDNGIYDETKFLTITETEVELAQAFAYYKMSKDKSKYPNATTDKYQSFILSNPLICNIFDKMSYTNKPNLISKEDYENLISSMELVLYKKNEQYQNLNESILKSHKYEFIKYLLNISVNE